LYAATHSNQIYTLSLHDALPISRSQRLATRSDPHTSNPCRRCQCDVFAAACDRVETPASASSGTRRRPTPGRAHAIAAESSRARSEEHTSELQSLAYLVCRLLLE